MSLGWIKDFTKYNINCLLLLEKKQIEWIDEEYRIDVWATVFQTHEYIAWYFIHKCEEKKDWVLKALKYNTELDKDEACVMALKLIEDWLVFVTDPKLYDNLEFLNWDEKELTSLTSFDNKRIIDIGSGTGKQAFAVASNNNYVYCCEPVGNLRDYLKDKAKKKGLKQFYVSDGELMNLPYEDEFADVTMGGHVFGEYLEDEYQELMRVTKIGGMIILIPGNNDCDNDIHKFLIDKGFMYGRFLEPGDGYKRKYWKVKK